MGSERLFRLLDRDGLVEEFPEVLADIDVTGGDVAAARRCSRRAARRESSSDATAITGPSGCGKTSLTEALARALAHRCSMAVITNDIYTREDADYLVHTQVLPEARIKGVETGGCPHTAIREDASINLAAIAELNRDFPDLDLILVESGGDNLSATFSPELVDMTIYVIDVAAGEEIPRKGGPAITKSDILVINKTDLAPYVGADLAVMDHDARHQRGARPYVFTNLKTGEGLARILTLISEIGGLATAPVPETT